MKINIKATNIELTPAIKRYIEEKIGSLKKFIRVRDLESAQVRVEVGMTTRHHHSGDIFRAEIQIRLPRFDKGIRTESNQSDLYAAIDVARDRMKRELLKIKGRKMSLVKRGARAIKSLIPFLHE